MALRELAEGPSGPDGYCCEPNREAAPCQAPGSLSARDSVQSHVPNWEKATGQGWISIQASISSAALIKRCKAACKGRCSPRRSTASHYCVEVWLVTVRLMSAGPPWGCCQESWVLVLTLLLFHPGQAALPCLGLSSFSCMMGWWLEYPRG